MQINNLNKMETNSTDVCLLLSTKSVIKLREQVIASLHTTYYMRITQKQDGGCHYN